MRTPILRPLLILALGLALIGSSPRLVMAYANSPGQCTATGSLPAHGPAMSGNGGFTITPSAATYDAGQPLTVTLGHPSNATFKGILLYAFDNAAGPDHVGSFAFPAGYAAVNLGCPGDPDGTLGQTTNSDKGTPVDFTWTAPASGGSLTFAAIVVVSFTEYYVLDPVVVDPNTIGVPSTGGSSPAAISLLANAPNPFRDATHIRYTLGRSATTSVRIYDLMGRALRDLPPLTQSAGEQVRRWDGRDADGSPLPSGVYFYRVEADGESAVGKVVIRRD